MLYKFYLFLLPIYFFNSLWAASYEEASKAYAQKDYKKTVELLTILSDQGNAYAQFSLGYMYDYGKGVIENQNKAFNLYTLSSNQGLASAQQNLGAMYRRGGVVKQDYKEAVKLYTLAAQQGYNVAQNDLGKMYEIGKGVKKDYKKALSLYILSSNQGYPWAHYSLSEMYQEGKGVKKDYKEFKRLFELALTEIKEYEKQTYHGWLVWENTNSNYNIDKIATLLQKTKQKKINKKRYLIVIGVENYEYTDNIIYSQHTSLMFTKVAQKTLGISKSNTLELTSKNASMGRIQMKMKKLLRRVKKGDSIYFYYSGHGIPVISQKNEPYILPIDVEPEFISEAPFFKLKNIYKTLADSKASKVVAFVDSCFSGTTDGVSVIKGVAATRLKPKNVTFNKKKMVIITAGKDKQYSNMYEEKGYRLFSYYLMESMLKGRTDLKDIYNELYLNVKDKSYEMGDMKLQEPTISGNKGLKL